VSYLKIAVVACRVVMTCHDHHPTIAPLWFARVESAHAEAARPITNSQNAATRLALAAGDGLTSVCGPRATPGEEPRV
jgi:hypothetical protein